jgi:hypothetical protein
LSAWPLAQAAECAFLFTVSVNCTVLVNKECNAKGVELVIWGYEVLGWFEGEAQKPPQIMELLEFQSHHDLCATFTTCIIRT